MCLLVSEGTVDYVVHLTIIVLGWMLIRCFTNINNLESILLLFYVQITDICIHMAVDYPTPIAGLRLYSLSIQGGVIETWILSCLSKKHNWNQPKVYWFASISILVDIAFIPFLKTHSLLFDGISLIAGGVFLLSRYPWNTFPHAPRFLYSSRVCAVTWSSLFWRPYPSLRYFGHISDPFSYVIVTWVCYRNQSYSLTLFGVIITLLYEYVRSEEEKPWLLSVCVMDRESSNRPCFLYCSDHLSWSILRLRVQSSSLQVTFCAYSYRFAKIRSNSSWVRIERGSSVEEEKEYFLMAIEV